MPFPPAALLVCCLFLIASQGGIERIAQAVAEQVETQHQQADEDSGNNAPTLVVEGLPEEFKV